MEFSQSLFRPAEVGSQLHLSKMNGHSPVGSGRIALVPVDLVALLYFEQFKNRAALLRHVFNVFNQDLWMDLLAEEKLQ